MKALEVRLTRGPGDERVVGQLAETRPRAAGEAESILDGVAAAAARWRSHAREAGVSEKNTRIVQAAIGECLARI